MKMFYLMVTGADVNRYDPMDHLFTEGKWTAVVSSNFKATIVQVANMHGLANYRILEK